MLIMLRNFKPVSSILNNNTKSLITSSSSFFCSNFSSTKRFFSSTPSSLHQHRHYSEEMENSSDGATTTKISTSFLDPPFSPLFRDERQKQQRTESSSSSSSTEFIALCSSCRSPVFDSDAKFPGYPGYPSFSKVTSFSSSCSPGSCRTTDVLDLKTDTIDSILNTPKNSDDIDQENNENENEIEKQQKIEDENEIPDFLKGTPRKRKKSLKLLEEPPVMRWGITAIPPTQTHDKKSEAHITIERKQQRELEKKTFRGEVSTSKKLHTINNVRNAPNICRGYCRHCDQFVCVVVNSNLGSGRMSQRFVCNPSSLIFVDK